MSSNIERYSPAYYSRLINQLGYKPSLSEGLTHGLLNIRELCKTELRSMQELVSILHPVPTYIIYAGASQSSPRRWYCHSVTRNRFAQALICMHDGKNDGRFTVDGNNQIVLAENNSLIPVVSAFTPVIESANVSSLPEEHLGIQLYSQANKLIEKAGKLGVTLELLVLMIAEGLNETIENISETKEF